MSNVIVSLTTLPVRLIEETQDGTGIRPGLKTILEQTGPEYEVHLNIPYSYKKKKITLPVWLSEWQEQYSHLKVFRCCDYGAVTKLYPTIQRVTNPNTIIITADDDLIYQDGFVAAHVEARKKYPDCAIGFAGIYSIDTDPPGMYYYASTQPDDVRVRILEGYKTVSYLRSFFDNELDEFVFSHWNDDVSISAYLGYKNIKKMVLQCPDCTDYRSRVESFPVIKITPMEHSVSGCNECRRDVDIMQNADEVSTEWFRLQYLER